MKLFSFVIISILFFNCSKIDSTQSNLNDYQIDKDWKAATFAGGCFWCIEAPFEKIDGVKKAISGYAGGTIKNPTYKQVSGGKTKYREAVQVYYDPNIISYSELLDIFWQQFDPTDEGGSFYDRGFQYTSAIYYHNENQKEIAEKSKVELENSGLFDKKIVTKIEKYTNFYPAEDYHQDYYLTNSKSYKKYRTGSGRDRFIEEVWNRKNEMAKEVKKEELKKKLTELQYRVTQENGTERPFNNEYWNNKEKGIYVDVVSGEPLFSSKDKFKSGTGWPSFTKPINPQNVKKLADNSGFMERIEVRSKLGNSHLGHVFNDGLAPTKLRYCVNSASLKFIPKSKMEEEGYKNYLWLVE